jgi:glycine oxidase
MSGSPARPAVAVVGGGVIGLSCAWQLAESGCQVELFDPAPGQGASHAAAGMLAPVSEATYGEEALLAAGLASAQAWPRFAAHLIEASGIDVGLRQEGSLLVGHDPDDAQQLRRLGALLERHGLEAEPLTARQARSLEPALSPRTASALSVPGDHSVDNRRLVTALTVAAERAGTRLHRGPAQPVMQGGAVVGVRHPGASAVHRADLVVLAAGVATSSVAGLPAHALPPVRPVKGQILRLRGAAGLLSRTVRALVSGVPVYLVPRADGELVVGATTEDVGLDRRVTAGAVLELLRAAAAVVPEVGELELGEALARFRPATPDNLPAVGLTDVPALAVATGHHRGGVLLAPLTAQAVVSLALGRPAPAAAGPLSPTRFAAAVERSAS